MKYKWEAMFSPRVLERGYDYYMTGAVEDLEQNYFDDTIYEAHVDGSAEYCVEIQYSNGMVIDMECDCPHAMDGNNCKHMAAVLYEIEHKRETHGHESVPSEDITELICKIPEDDLRAFLIELCTGDERLSNRVLLRYSNSVGKSQLEQLFEELEVISDQYSDRRGYITWEHTGDYEIAVMDFLDVNTKILLGRGCVMEAFDLVTGTLDRVEGQGLDDSDGTTSEIASCAGQCFSDMIAAGNQSEKEKIFDWFEARIKNNDAPEYAQYMISDVFNTKFREKEFLLRKLQLFDSKGVPPREDNWHAKYVYQENIIRSLKLMEELGYSEQQLLEYMKKHWDLSEIRKKAANRAVSRGDIEEAIRILRESKELDRNRPGLIDEYSQELIRLYRKVRNKKEYRAELEFQVFSCRQSDFTYISMLKEQCQQEEWEDLRERIFKSSSCAGIRFSLMESEGLLGRLIQEIAQTKSPNLMDRYENALKKKFPERVRDVYVDYITRDVQSASNRKEYHHLIQYLKKIRKYPDGARIAGKIAEDWKALYHRRRAMMDELREAGF